MEPTNEVVRPHGEYTHLLQLRRTLRETLAWRERVLGNSKVIVFLLAGLGVYLAFGPHLFSPWWLVVPLLGFSILLVWHERVTRSWLRASRAVAFYERGLARIEDRWRGTGQPGHCYVDDHHPNATDLDLFGKDSLFELLCTARTRTGEDTLAGWLKSPASPAEVRGRQAAVAELRPRLDLREDLALLGANVPHGVDLDGLGAWGAEPPLLIAIWPRFVALALGLCALTALVGWLVWDWGVAPLFGVLFVEGGLALYLGQRVGRVIGAVEKRARDMTLLAGVLGRLERETFSSPLLSRLRAALDTTGDVPSHRIAQLSNLIDLLNSRKNQVFLPFALLLMWTTQMAFAIERWRRRSGPAIRGWLDVVGEIEALCSLATYAHENPADPFPEILDAGPCVEGEDLGHPLIPLARCVRNDIRLDDSLRVLVMSGSNMSGKSTMLRTVGINTVLALAGAPVRARRMKVSPLVVGATLRIQDSLVAGKSRFMAEVERVRHLVDLSRGQPPLLFLIDEIFSGTNSHDRRIGAEAVVRGLVHAGAIGLVTTHDLALTHIVDVLAPRAANVHFADYIRKDEPEFDYKMRPGVVQHSNALALMRKVGLDV
jgi:hypothetical protein